MSTTGNHRAQIMYPLEPCEVCGSEKSERHHKDDDTLNNDRSNIQFLCRKHHMEVDGRLVALVQGPRSSPRGELNGASKLTEDQVKVILASPASARSLADEYGVSHSLITAILRGDRWGHLKRT